MSDKSEADKEDLDLSTPWSENSSDVFQESFGEDSFSTSTFDSGSTVENDQNMFDESTTIKEEAIAPQRPVGKDNKNRPIGKERSNERVELTKSLECTIIAAAGAINGAVAGFVFGGANHLFTGLFQRRHQFPGFGREILVASRLTSGMFALWLGTYNGSSCAIKHIRKQTVPDKLTVFGSGFTAGFVSSLRTRSLRAMVTNGAVSGGLVMVFDALKM